MSTSNQGAENTGQQAKENHPKEPNWLIRKCGVRKVSRVYYEEAIRWKAVERGPLTYH